MNLTSCQFQIDFGSWIVCLSHTFILANFISCFMNHAKMTFRQYSILFFKVFIKLELMFWALEVMLKPLEIRHQSNVLFQPLHQSSFHFKDSQSSMLF